MRAQRSLALRTATLFRTCAETSIAGAAALPAAAAAAATPGVSEAAADDVITPWEVKARGPKGVDYKRVTETFQAQPVDDTTVAAFSRAFEAVRTRKGSSAAASDAHHLVRRGCVFAHRDADAFLDGVAAPDGGRGYLYTGRGPSASAMHIGHIIPFLFTRHLQQALDLPLVIQITDDEKFLFRGIDAKAMDKMTTANIKDIIAFGLDREKTFIFRNTKYMGDLYPTVLEVQRLMTGNAVKNTFGFTDVDNVGKFAFPATQAAPSFVSSFPRVLPCKSRNVRCLIPCAVHQDPFFVLTRNIADRIKRPKPALLLTKFMPALKGAQHKMSSSAEENGTILVTDEEKVIRRKLKRAFSGGRGTLEQLQEEGADLDVDVAYQLLVFLCPDDAKVDSIGRDYKSGVLSSGAVKEAAGDVVSDVLAEFKARRASVTDADVEHFMSVRSIW